MAASSRPAPELLRAQVADVRTLTALLRPISFSKLAHVHVSDRGLAFTTTNNRSVQANAYLSRALFHPYRFNPPARDSGAERSRASKRQRLERSTPPTTAITVADEDEGDDEEQARGRQQGEDAEEEEEEEEVMFEVNLANLLQCLGVFGGAQPVKGQPVLAGIGGAGGRGVSAGVGRGGGAAGGGFGRDREFVRADRDRERGVTAMLMTYRAEGEPLTLLLEESSVITRCELSTFDPSEEPRITFDHQRTVGFVIMPSEWLSDALQGVDNSCTTVALRFAPRYHSKSLEQKQVRQEESQAETRHDDVVNSEASGHTAAGTSRPEMGYTQSTDPLVPSTSSVVALGSKPGAGRSGPADGSQGAAQGVPMFKMTVDGDLGSAEYEFPNDPGVLERFQCTHDVENLYRASDFALARNALQGSLKTSIRVDDVGLLSMQFMMPRGDGGDARRGAGGPAPTAATAALDHGFVELICVPLDDDGGAGAHSSA